VAIRFWLQAQPVQQDATALHADIASGRTGAEVTFDATVVAAPVSVGAHEQIEVRDALGDELELDYNTQLGQWISVGVGEQLVIHGQLYVDPRPGGTGDSDACAAPHVNSWPGPLLC